MQAILGDIGALMGVMGSFVCDRQGALVGHAMPAGTNEAALAVIGRSLMQTLTGLEVDRHKRPSELDMVFAGGMLMVKNLGTGCLCVLCARQANVAMVNMTANMAARKLKDALGQVAAAPGGTAPAPKAAMPPAPAPPAAAPVATAPPAATGVPVAAALVTQIEHELARLVGPVAMLAVDDATTALGCTRQTLPAGSLPAWIERLGAEIPDAAKRAQFVQSVRKLARLD